MKFFIIAGEASGDLHASNLMKALRDKCSNALFVGLGGDRMREEGCKIYVDYREMAYMGIVAVVQNIRKIKRNFQLAKESLMQEKPDVLVLVDYPSFNLKMAAFCKKHLPKTKVVYYIPPKIWAWKEWRVHKIAQYTDEVLGIFPFEPAFYAKHGYKCHYIGNPVADSIRSYKSQGMELEKEKIIALLPGSRKSEISKCLPTMLAAARKVAGEEYRIVVTAAPGIEDGFYRPYLQEEALTRNTYELVSRAHSAVVNSGTATLETALLGCPQTAVYQVAGSKYLEKVLKPIIFRIAYFTLVNIIPNKEVIQELVASRFTEENIIGELSQLQENEHYRQIMLKEYKALWEILGETSAAEGAAERIMALL